MDALALDSVRCLDCATVYAKPHDRGTMASNPGCPDCGYVGWVTNAVSEAGPRVRSASDRLQRRLAQRG